MGNKKTTEILLSVLLFAGGCFAQTADASKLRGRLIGTTSPIDQQGYGWQGSTLSWVPTSFATQSGISNYCAPSGASTTAYACNLNPALSAYGSGGLFVLFKPDVTNTGACTVNINFLGAKNIQKLSGGSLVSVAAGDLISGGPVYVLAYNGSVFVVISSGSSGGTAVNISMTGTGTSSSTCTIPAGAVIATCNFTLTASTATGTLTGQTTGQFIAYKICQDGVGGWDYTPPTNVLNFATVEKTATSCTAQIGQVNGSGNLVAISGSLISDIGGVGQFFTAILGTPPITPPSGALRLYANTTYNTFNFKNSAGVDVPLGASVVNAQTGTTYTFVDGDRGKLVTGTNGSAQAYTLPQAGASSSFISGWYVDVQSRGAGTLTITPTTSTIDGAASLALTQNQGVRIVSDGTNYYTQRGVGGGTSVTWALNMPAGTCDNAGSGNIPLWNIVVVANPATKSSCTGTDTDQAQINFGSTGSPATTRDFIFSSPWASGTATNLDIWIYQTVGSGNIKFTAKIGCINDGDSGIDFTYNASSSTTVASPASGVVKKITISSIATSGSSTCSVGSNAMVKLERDNSVGTNMAGTAVLMRARLYQ